MATEGHFGDYDRWLELVAGAQRYKLRLNAHKGFLGDVPVATLLNLLKGEVAELEEAASRGSAFEMIVEAADVANFALGIVIAATRGAEGVAVQEKKEPVPPVHEPWGAFYAARQHVPQHDGVVAWYWDAEDIKYVMDSQCPGPTYTLWRRLRT